MERILIIAGLMSRVNHVVDQEKFSTSSCQGEREKSQLKAEACMIHQNCSMIIIYINSCKWSMPAPRIDSRENWMAFKLSCKQQILVK